MKALTVRQPWAWCIALGAKTVENRSRPIKHRGPLAIHAGAAWDNIGVVDPAVLDVLEPWLMATERERRRMDAAYHAGRVRGVVGVVDVVGCHRANEDCCQPWGTSNRWHWELANAYMLDDLIPASGRLGLWDIDLADPPTTLADSGRLQ